MPAKRRPTKARLARVRMIIFDFDGVLTDNYVFVGENGERFKRFWVPDGVGIFLAHKAGIKFAIITGNRDKSTRVRAEYLRIDDVFQGVLDKAEAYNELKRRHRLDDEECLYVGDDLPDKPVFEQVGIAVAPSDAHPQMKRLAHWIGDYPGGRGIVRETIDAVMEARGNGTGKPKGGKKLK